MRHGSDAGVELLFRQLIHHLYTVFMLNDSWVSPRIIHCDVKVVLIQGLVDINHLGIAHVGAIFLEGEAENEDVATAISTLWPFLPLWIVTTTPT